MHGGREAKSDFASILERYKEVYSCTYFDESCLAPSLVALAECASEASCLSPQQVTSAMPCSTDGKQLQPVAAAGAAAQIRNSNILTKISQTSQQVPSRQPARNAILHNGGSRDRRLKRKAMQSAQDALLARQLQKELSRADAAHSRRKGLAVKRSRLVTEGPVVA